MKKYDLTVMFCQKCGEENKDSAAFCNKCGTDLRMVIVFPEPQSINSKLAADNILVKIQELEGQKKGHVGPLILVIIGLALFFIGTFPLLFGLDSAPHYSSIGKLLMLIAIIWDVWRMHAATKLETEITMLRNKME